MYPKIVDAKTTDNYVILVKFDNDIVKRFDFSKMLTEPRFEALKNKALFSCFQIDKGGYGISWTDDIDISEYEIWMHGDLVN